MYNNKIFIMIMAGSMTMGLLNSSDCLSKTIKENNVVIMSENEYGIKNRANIKKISNLKRLHDDQSCHGRFQKRKHDLKVCLKNRTSINSG